MTKIKIKIKSKLCSLPLARLSEGLGLCCGERCGSTRSQRRFSLRLLEAFFDDHHARRHYAEQGRSDALDINRQAGAVSHVNRRQSLSGVRFASSSLHAARRLKDRRGWVRDA